MRNWKRLVALGVSAMMLASLAGCSTTKSETANGGEAGDKTAEASSGGSLEGTNVFMFKSTGNTFGDLMYEGFSEYLETKGQKTAYKSPAETTVAAQVQMLDELITQKVASITISTNGDAGYDEVFKKAKEAGIPIVSIDSEANPEYRVCHVNQAETADIGSYLIQAAVLITLGVDYPGDGKMEETVKSELDKYSGDEIKLGVLSASIDTPVQNSWIAEMEKELAKDFYTGKVSPNLDKKYGNDDLTESTTQAQAFIAENSVDCIISPTTVGIAAAGQALKSANSDIRLTGLGLPSEMQSFMPKSSDDNAFDSVCPYMMLWDVIHLGAVAGAAIDATLNDGFDGKVGSSFSMDKFRDYDAATYEAYQSGDGTAVLAGTPFIFDKDNMSEWIDVL
ncbi:substrate-binding domain-containing protein [Faecalicatena contorta]|uniref:Rhamnose transport system substrate-binding protein n=1 Tax=Faecalicatena contorta TaxID=39482 RepID=A0A315ZZ52_9FIRM|nr:substrate-binding domain-containing protein [Faecalicatena contorta]PWJ49724.1 rhamnose transport system substrate-binding protein [Faecalicatena contorta]SUQ14442.1 rhamnose transport system substrate-binding protein [Faecalicatena contorta]